MKRETLEIVGDRIKLRRLRLSDYKEIYSIMQDKDMVKYVISIPWPYKRIDSIKWIIKSYYEIKKRKGYTFAIVFKGDDKIIGALSLIKINYENKNAEIGYWLGKKYWRQGIMTEAVKLILKFSFEKLKLHKVYAKLFEENIASRKVLEKCGFKLEGFFREQRFKHNRWHNELRFGILNSEFKD